MKMRQAFRKLIFVIMSVLTTTIVVVLICQPIASQRSREQVVKLLLDTQRGQPTSAGTYVKLSLNDVESAFGEIQSYRVVRVHTNFMLISYVELKVRRRGSEYDEWAQCEMGTVVHYFGPSTY